MQLYHPILAILWQVGTYEDNRCKVFEDTLICEGIQQEDFLYQVYKNEEYLSENYVTSIEIINSNFSHIKSFSKPELFGSSYMELSLRNCSIQAIDKNAFQGFKRLGLDLGDNFIKNISFIENLPLTSLNLENNRIEVLDLNVLAPFYNLEKIILKGNNIIEIYPLPLAKYEKFRFIDLSFNHINEFNETYLNCSFSSINLGYNNLHAISVLNNRNVLNLSGNNVTSLGPYANRTFTCSEVYLTSVPIDLPGDFNVYKVFSLANAKIETLNKDVFNIAKISRYSSPTLIDFSNSSIRNISEFYFEGFRIPVLNLSHNNIDFNGTIFKDSSITYLDLSFSGITSLPENTFEGLTCETVNLTGNFLESVENICKFVKFSTIDLSYNRISRIGVKTFTNCKNLLFLNISHSGIDSIEPRSFAGLLSLYFLDLSYNNIITLKGDTFMSLPRIVTIDLSGNTLGVLETNSFHDLSLTNIILSNATMKYIQNRAFNNLYNLRNLNLSNTGLAFIERNPFHNLPSLETIDLSYNDLTTIESHTIVNSSIRNLFLQGNKIKIVKSRAFENLKNSFNSLNLSSLGIQTLEPYSFSGITVEAIDLSNNNISEIVENVFFNTTATTIYLENNNISSISALDESVNVRELRLNFNGVLRPRAFNNIHLKRLFLVNSSIELLMSNCFIGLFNLEELHFDGSVINSYEQGALNGLFHLQQFDASSLFSNTTVLEKDLFSEMSGLKTLQISNVIITDIQLGAFSGLNNLNELYLTNNSLSFVNGSVFDDLKSLKLLDLSNNSIGFINLTYILNETVNLRTLRLSFNRLGSISLNNSQPSKLTALFLDNNLISNLNASIFQGSEGLQTLHLQNNRLQRISYGTFRNLTDLQELRMDGNQFNQYSLYAGVFAGLNNLEILNISGNTNLFYQKQTDLSVWGLRGSNLRTISLDNTYLSSFDYESLKEDNRQLKTIAINYNRFSCSTLSTMLKYFRNVGVDYTPQIASYDVLNIEGIVCYS